MMATLMQAETLFFFTSRFPSTYVSEVLAPA